MIKNLATAFVFYVIYDFSFCHVCLSCDVWIVKEFSGNILIIICNICSTCGKFSRFSATVGAVSFSIKCQGAVTQWGVGISLINLLKYRPGLQTARHDLDCKTLLYDCPKGWSLSFDQMILSSTEKMWLWQRYRFRLLHVLANTSPCSVWYTVENTIVLMLFNVSCYHLMP